MNTLREICLAPENAAAFPPSRLLEIERALAEGHKADMPWYLRVIIGIGAWIASIFLIGFAGTLIGWGDSHKTTLGVFGIVLLVAAVVLGRQRWGVFADQCALAASLAAQVMIYLGFIDEHQYPLRTAMIFSTGLAAILYLVFPNFLSRLMTCFAALQIALLWIHTGDHGDIFSSPSRSLADFSLLTLCFWAFHLAGICLALLRPRASITLAPLGHALIASLAAWQIENLCGLWGRNLLGVPDYTALTWTAFHFRTALTGFALLGVAVWAAGGAKVLREKARLFAGLALVVAALIYLGLTGVLLAMLCLLLGFSLQDRAVLGVGLILFPVFLAQYYYNLNLDLLAKSGVLVASGALLLLLRAGVARGLFADKEAA